MKRNLLFAILMLIPLLASADAVEIDGLYYNLDMNLKTAEVSKKTSGYYTGSINIPEKVIFEGNEYIVSSIGNRAFFKCTDVTSVTLPNSVTSISQMAFYGCQGISSIIIPNGVERIEQSTFAGCTNLSSVSLPNNLKFIGSAAFRNCKVLSSIDIPSGTTGIWLNAFENCFSLTSITIPKSVSNIVTGYLNCPSLSSIKIESDNPYYDSRNNCNAIIETSSNTLITGCMNTIIPDGVTTIGNSAFGGCTGLLSLKIPSSVTSINNNAFDSCSGITSLIIPSTITSIGNGAFSGCSSLTSIYVESGNKKYDSRNDCNAIIETSSNKLITGCMNTKIPDNVTCIGDDAFACCSNLTSIAIPNSVTTIEAYAFRLCDHLTSITIPNSVTSIGECAFFECNGLALITISESVKSIGKDAFCGCRNMKSIIVEIGNEKYDSRNDCNAIIETSSNKLITGCMNTKIPDNVTIIGYWAFTECIGLSSLTIPASITTIEEYAFGSCINLLDVYCYSERAPSTDFSFGDIDLSKSILHVPAASIDIYKNALEWKDFGRIVALSDDDPKPTGIESTFDNNHSYPIGAYTIEGKRINNVRRGLNILRMNDGTIKKVMVR